MKLYDNPTNINSRKIRATAKEVGVELTLVPVNFEAGEHKSEAFLKMNPNGKVPTLTDGDFNLWESNAIMCYIAASRGPTHLLPTAAREKAQVEQWLFWQTAHLASAFGKIMFERIYKERFNLGKPDPAAIATGFAEVERFTTVLNTALKNREFIVTRQYTVADFAIAATLGMRDMAEVNLAPYAEVTSWLRRIETLPSWVAVS